MVRKDWDYMVQHLQVLPLQKHFYNLVQGSERQFLRKLSSTYVSVLGDRQLMDCQCIQRNMNNMANDWQHDIQLSGHKRQDMDLYTCYLYKPWILDNQNSLHTLDDILHKDLRDIQVNIHKNQRHYVLYIEHWLHKDWVYMVQEFRAHVELRIEEVQLTRYYQDGSKLNRTDIDFLRLRTEAVHSW